VLIFSNILELKLGAQSCPLPFLGRGHYWNDLGKGTTCRILWWGRLVVWASLARPLNPGDSAEALNGRFCGGVVEFRSGEDIPNGYGMVMMEMYIVVVHVNL
jgi:hypothetical protein